MRRILQAVRGRGELDRRVVATPPPPGARRTAKRRERRGPITLLPATLGAGRAGFLAAVGLLLGWGGTGCASRPEPPPPPAAVSDANRLAKEAARLLTQENWAGAVAWWERAGRQYQLVNRPDQVALARHNEAVARRAMGESERARELWEESARLNRSSGQTNAWWRNQLALFQLEIESDPARAEARRAALEPRREELGAQPAVAPHWTHECARLLLVQGRVGESLGDARLAVAGFDAVGDGAGAASAWVTVARGHEAAGRFEEATAAWRTSLGLFEVLGHPRGIAVALAGLGARLVADGQATPGRELLERARDNFRALRLEAEARGVEAVLGAGAGAGGGRESKERTPGGAPAPAVQPIQQH